MHIGCVGVSTVIRFDQNAWPEKAEITPEGFLRVDAPITRMGVLMYEDADGVRHGELRHPDDWSTPDALASFRSLPITDGHPPPRPSDGQALVDARSAKDVTIGWTGENVRPEGADIRAPMLIADADGVAKIRRGRRGTSTGVIVSLEEEEGMYEGLPYKFRQTKPRGNHIAIVDSPRAGTMIRLDGAGNQLPEGARTMDKKVSTVVLDGISYEAAPEVANALTKAEGKVKELQTRLDATEAKVTEASTERDALKAKIDSFEKRDLSTEIANGVKARTALVAVALKALPKDEQTKLDGMTDLEIKKAVVAAKLPSFKLDGRNEQDIAIAYDIAVAEVSRADEDERTRTDALSEQRRQMTPRADGGTDDLGEALTRAEKRINEQWRPKAA